MFIFGPKFRPVFALLVALNHLLPNSNATLYDDIDFADDEKRLLTVYEHRGGASNWTWSVQPFCRVLCSRRMGLDHKWTYLATKEVLLPGPGCAKMELEIFVCGCTLRRPGRYLKMASGRDYYINGPSGEVYELRHACGRCDEEDTLTIFDRIVGVDRAPYLMMLPKLMGVGRIFEAQNVYRTYWRQHNKNRIAGKIPNSSEED